MVELSDLPNGKEAVTLQNYLDKFVVAVRAQRKPVPFLLTMSQRVQERIRMAFRPTDEHATFDDLLESTSSLADTFVTKATSTTKADPDAVARREQALLAFADELRTIPDRVSGLGETDAVAVSAELRTLATERYKAALASALDASPAPAPPDTSTLLIEEARRVLPALLLAFVPAEKLRFRHARLQELLAVAPPTATTAGYRAFFNRFQLALERVSPDVAAPGYTPLSAAQIIDTLGRVMTSSYSWAEASVPWSDLVADASDLSAAVSAVMAGVHEAYDGTRVPEWTYCSPGTSVPGVAAHNGGQPSSRRRNRGRGGGGGNNDAESDNTGGGGGQQGDTTNVQGSNTSQRQKPTLYECPVHGTCTHKPADCRVLKAREGAAGGQTQTQAQTVDKPAGGAAAPARSGQQGNTPAAPRRSQRIAGQQAGGQAGQSGEDALHYVRGGGAPLTTAMLINNETFTGIIDTGASRTCVSASIADKLGLARTDDPSPPGGPDQQLVGTGKMALVHLALPAITDRPLAVDNVPVYILNGETDKVLLGADLLRRVGLMTNHSLFLSLPPPAEDDPAEGLPYHPYLDEEVGHVGDGPPVVECPDDFPLKEELASITAEYADVFAELDGTGADIGVCTINLREEAKLPRSKPRPLRRDTLERVHEKIDALRERGIVRDASGDVASPAVVATKKGQDPQGRDNIRLCADYRELNDATVPDLFPVPDVRAYLQDLPPWTYYFTADCSESYHQLPMANCDVHLTALTVPGRFVEYLFAPFGLKNLPGQFQRAIQRVLEPLHGHLTRNYFDDIVGGADAADELLIRWRSMLDICRDRNLRLKARKCKVGFKELEVLGVLVSSDGRRILPERVAAITAIAPPRNVAELRRFIGQVCYVADFVQRCQLELKPLHALTADGAEWVWGEAEQAAFLAVREALTSDVVLARPDLDKEWHLETDASLSGVGGILWQLDPGTEERRVVTYFSHAFSAVQSRWSTFDQEMYGVVYCLTRSDMAPLFKAHPRLHVYTDHRNLVFLRIKAIDNRKLLRWLLTLQEYQFTIHHVPGADNKVADFLSRYKPDDTIAAVQDQPSLTASLREAQAAADEGERATWDAPAANSDGLATLAGKIVVPRQASALKDTILTDAHRYHGGVNATAANVRGLGYAWVGLDGDAERHVRDCILCQKTRLANFVSTSMGTTARSRPFETVAIDTVGPIQIDSQHNRFVFVMTDMFSRFVELYPAPSNNSAAAAHALYSAVFCRHGLPSSILSDNGSEYANRVVMALMDRLKVTHHRSIPYRPQSNGLVERRNREIKRHLRVLTACFGTFEQWSSVALPYVQLILNTTPHSVTGFAPMDIIYGSHARPRRFALTTEEEVDPRDPLGSWSEYVATLTDHIDSVCADALRQQEEALQGRSIEPTEIEAGDLVLLENQRQTKLHGHLGPFKVTAVGDNHAVTIAPILGGAPRTVHAAQLIIVNSPWDEDRLVALQAGDDEELYVEYVVEALADGRLRIKWVGWEETSDEPLAQVRHTPAVQEFLDSEEGRMWYSSL